MNMSDRRFQNTQGFLGDCATRLWTLDPKNHGKNETYERQARREILHLAFRMLEEVSCDMNDGESGLDKLIDAMDEGEGYEPAD